MKNNDSFREQMLDRVREGKQPEVSQRKRKLSKVLIIVDGILIALILMFFLNKEDTRVYHSTSLDLNNVQYRFSLGIDEDTGGYLFSLAMKSLGTKGTRIFYNKSIAKLTIYHESKAITEKDIGKGIAAIKLLPGEVKTFVIPVENSEINHYIKKNPDTVPSRTRTLFQFEGPNLPLEAKITINSKEPVSTALKFKYEVKK